MRYLFVVATKLQKPFELIYMWRNVCLCIFIIFSDIISFVYFACKKVSLLAPEFQLLLIKMIWL